MLKKILKYDLKWCYKPLMIFYILAIFFAVVTRIVNIIDNSFMFMIIGKILQGVIISMLINIIINNFMRVWVRVNINLYKDESYLTHTLPTSKQTIYTSKVLTAIITLFTSCIVVIATIAIAYLTKDNWKSLKNILEGTAIIFDSSVTSLIVTMTSSIFVELLFVVIAGILGITIGNRFNNAKTLKSILIGFAIYIFASNSVIAIMYLIGLCNPDILKLFTNSTEISTEVLKTILYIQIVIYLAYNTFFYLLGNKILKKGVNVE